MELEPRLRRFPRGWLGQVGGYIREFYLQFLRPHLAGLLPQPRPTAPPVVSIADSGELSDVVVFPVIDWGFLEQRPHHFARRLAEAGHRCFYLSTRFGPEQAVALPCTPPVWGVQLPGPHAFDLYRQHWSAAQQEIVWQGLQRMQQRYRIGSAVALVQHPFWTPLVVRAQKEWGWKIVYDCMDDHHAFPGVRDRLGEEQELARHCHCIITSHPRLAARFPGSLLVPNGADFDHFARPRAFRPLHHLARPIVGYHGMIGDWLDVPLLAEAARARPDWSFVLVGPRQGFGWLPLARLDNVHLLDAVAYCGLPCLVQDFDVGCIPFRPGPLTASTDPVKLYEMLAAGRPVVASGLEGNWEGVITAAPGCPLAPVLEVALADANPTRAQNFARENTWDQRFESFYQAAFWSRQA